MTLDTDGSERRIVPVRHAVPLTCSSGSELSAAAAVAAAAVAAVAAAAAAAAAAEGGGAV